VQVVKKSICKEAGEKWIE